MFDFIGDYIAWTHQDGWTFGSIILLGLGAAAVLLALLVVLRGLAFAVELGGLFKRGFRSGLTKDTKSPDEPADHADA